MLRSHNIPNFPSARRSNDRPRGGGIFDSASNNKELPSLEQAIAATANMDSWDNHASSGVAGGSGTSSDPYRIETTGQLAYFAKQSRMTTLTGYYSLENSLDMSEYLWFGIGSSTFPFRGEFNGNFNTVSGITMNVNQSINIGLSTGFFNYVEATASTNTICDLILNNGTIISSYQYVGCLAGQAKIYMHRENSYDYPDYNEMYICRCIVENYTVVADGGCYGISGIIVDSQGTDFQYYENGEWIDDEIYVYLESCMVKNCTFIDRVGGSIYGIEVSNGDHNRIYNSAVIDVTFISNSTNCGILPGTASGDYLGSCYAKTTYINTSTGVNQTSKVVSKALQNNPSWISGYFYSPSLNGGYPIPKNLLKISNAVNQTNREVYNYLLSLGFTVV